LIFCSLVGELGWDLGKGFSLRTEFCLGWS
jgi:hypothetical protein